MRPHLALLLLSACALDAGTFPDRYASAWCHRQRACARDDFRQAWEGMGDCRGELATDAEEGLDRLDVYFEGCALDDEAARACLDALRGASCEEFTGGAWTASCGEALVECR